MIASNAAAGTPLPLRPAFQAIRRVALWTTLVGCVLGAALAILLPVANVDTATGIGQTMAWVAGGLLAAGVAVGVISAILSVWWARTVRRLSRGSTSSG